MTLAVASKEKRPEIEIGQAGKRLEELSEISKRTADSDQSGKTKQLLASFENKVNSAQNGLTEIENNGAKARIAKVINTQTEKYTEVLVETKENLPDAVGNEVSEKLASAVESNEKVNFQSLAIMVETIDENEGEKEEIAAKVKEKIDELDEKIIINDDGEDNTKTEDDEEAESGNEDDNAEELIDAVDESDNTGEDEDDKDSEDLTSEPKTATEKAKEDLEKAGASLESGDLSEAMESIINVNIAVDLIDSENKFDPAGDEPGEDKNQGDESGEVEVITEESADLEEEKLE